jgi:nicotinamidase-related amidase
MVRLTETGKRWVGEKRRKPRHSLQLPVECSPVESACACSGLALNIGEDGLLVDLPRRFRLGQKVRDLSIDFLIAMGEKASIVVESAVRHGMDRQKTKVATSYSEAISMLESWMQQGDWILVKGSRRMAMEKIAEGLALLYKTRRGDAET